MARNKSRRKKQHLTHALNKNERAPVWVYMKTKSRDLIRGRKRSWRFDKLGKRIIKKDKKSESYAGRRNPKKKVSRKRTGSYKW
ncbi:MAG: hypothetical protein QXO69_02670 [archaeon]